MTFFPPLLDPFKRWNILHEWLASCLAQWRDEAPATFPPTSIRKREKGNLLSWKAWAELHGHATVYNCCGKAWRNVSNEQSGAIRKNVILGENETPPRNQTARKELENLLLVLLSNTEQCWQTWEDTVLQRQCCCTCKVPLLLEGPTTTRGPAPALRDTPESQWV